VTKVGAYQIRRWVESKAKALDKLKEKKHTPLKVGIVHKVKQMQSKVFNFNSHFKS
jgi:hypothetical protein